MHMSSKLFFLILIPLFLTACQGETGRHRSTGMAFQPKVVSEPPTVEIERDWTVEKVTVTCSESPCPKQVGVVLFLAPPANGKISIKRCTGFLAAQNQVITAGHCDYTANRQGYFITQSINGRSIVRRIRNLVRKEWTPHPTNPKMNSGRPDIGVFNLESPISEIEPAEIAKINDQKTSSWAVYVANERDRKMNFTIDRLSCNRRRHEVYFPFDLTEQPDVMYGFGCQSVDGNSGGPVFSADTGLVEAVVAGNSIVPSPAILVSNLRCLRSPDCVTNDKTLREHRYRLMQKNVLGALSQRVLANQDRYGLRFSPHFVGLKSSANEPEYEIVHRPICRLTNDAATAVVFPIEHIKVRFDEWGRIQLSQLALYETKATVSNRVGDKYQVSLNWPASFGRPTKDGTHPREIWGSRFHIVLPTCAR